MTSRAFDVSDVVDASDSTTEAWARLRGLMAMLALPEARAIDGTMRRPAIEIEVAPDVWQPVDSVAIEDTRVSFFSGSAPFVFVRNVVPNWRLA